MDPLIKLNFVIQGYVPNASDRILQGTISLNDLTYMTNFLIMSLLFIEFSNSCIMTILIIESFDYTVHMGYVLFLYEFIFCPVSCLL